MLVETSVDNLGKAKFEIDTTASLPEPFPAKNSAQRWQQENQNKPVEAAVYKPTVNNSETKKRGSTELANHSR